MPAKIIPAALAIRAADCTRTSVGDDRCGPHHDDVVAVRDGTISRAPGQEAVYLVVNTPTEHIRFRYLHMRPKLLDADGVVSGRKVTAGELLRVAPAAAEVVVLDRACPDVDHSGILPAGELNQQASRFAAIELRSALDRVGESQPAASGCESSRILCSGLDLNYVRHRVHYSFLIKGNG